MCKYYFILNRFTIYDEQKTGKTFSTIAKKKKKQLYTTCVLPRFYCGINIKTRLSRVEKQEEYYRWQKRILALKIDKLVPQ